MGEPNNFASQQPPVRFFEERVAQFLAERMDRVRTDPDAVRFAIERLAFIPDAKQALVLGAKTKRGILKCGRQWGKTSVIAVKAVHTAFTKAGALVLVTSPTMEQTSEFLMRVKDLLGRLGMRVRGDGGHALSVKLPNGSRIVGIPAKEASVRGFSNVSLLVIDEAAWVSDEVYQALLPMLSVGEGELWLMSTPKGRRGFFYEGWHGAGEWFRVEAATAENPRVSREYLEQQMREMPEGTFAREHLGEFRGGDEYVFSREMVEGAFDLEVETLYP